MLEKEIEKYLSERIKSLSGLCLKFVSPGLSGVPDRIIILNGKVHFVELKNETRRLSSVQKVIHRRFEKAGKKVHVINSKKGVDEFVRSIQTA